MLRINRLALGLCTLVLLIGAMAPANAQGTINPGIDVWTTIPGGGTFVNLDLPAGYFCDGSVPYVGPVNLQGVPLATTPPGILGGADTVVERLKPAMLTDGGGCAEVPIVVRALSLTGSAPIGVFCPGVGGTRWQVEACTCGCCGVQPITTIKVCDDGSGCGCGTFDGELKVDVCLKFRNLDDGTILGPVQKQISLSISNVPYCDKNPGAVLDIKEALMVDTNCDKQADLAIPCSSNFYPGATCGGPSCPPDICHAGPDHPHCVSACGRKQ